MDMSFAGGSNGFQSVYPLALDSQSRVVFGGNFTIFSGAPLDRIARLNADGTFDETFQPTFGAEGHITAIAHARDGKVIVAKGEAGISRSRIARLNVNGSV